MKLKYQIIKYIAAFLLVVMVGEFFAPSLAYALTSGPSQPEAQAFTPVGTSNLVDPFTGNFSYSIPLLELPGPNGGYPFVLGYNAGVTMDQEASWVGLGWNLSPGMINRQMRGFPDEFNGEKVETRQDMKPNVTVGLSVSASATQAAGELEIFGANLAIGANGSGSIGVYYNSYNGFGYRLAPQLGFSVLGDEGSLTPGLGASVSLDPNEGIGVSPSLSLTANQKESNRTFTLGTSLNSRRGLSDISISGSLSRSYITRNTSDTYDEKDQGTWYLKKSAQHLGGSSTYSFANTAYSPSITMPMVGSNFSFTGSFGGGANGVYPNIAIRGYYSQSKMAEDLKTEKAYGYLNLENADEESLMDFNRQNDGMIYRNSRYLSSPMGTHDVFTIAGQGAGGMFRAYRNQVGIFSDPKVVSTSAGINGGFEAGLPGHGGVNFGVNWSNSTSGPWAPGSENNHEINELDGLYGFDEEGSAQDYERYYFKSHGEPTTQPLNSLGYMGNNDPMEVRMDETGVINKKYRAQDGLYNELTNNSITPSQEGFDSDPDSRKPRNKVVTSISNGELGSIAQRSANDLSLDFMEVGYFDELSDLSGTSISQTNLDRSAYPSHHLGGFVNTEANGSRYVYGLPVYNHNQVECQFSVDGDDVANGCGPLIDIEDNDSDGLPDYKVQGTDKYLNRQEIPAHPYAWMLTAVLGSDYVDADDIPGPSDGDFGYWVKFNYIKTDDDQGWRAPFLGANYAPGDETSQTDDKGSYMYGRKEVYYLASAETKTHIAEFSISERYDARGAKKEIQPFAQDTLGGSAYRLDSIALFSKAERITPSGDRNLSAIAIQKVHFRYSYELCENVPNNVNTIAGQDSTGKLTLTELWFTYESNKRGELSPYLFDYHQDNDDENPDYHTHKNNRWGMYQPFNQVCDNVRKPWIDPYQNRATLDEQAGVYNLKEIQLPSGSTMEITYEADDYGYVQNKRAMHMVEIAGVGSIGNWDLETSKNPTSTDLMVYFELIEPIDQGDEHLIEEYDDGSGQLYFNLNTNLLDPGKNFYDQVRGYALVDEYGLATPSGSAPYSHGWVRLKYSEVNGRTLKYHPFCHAAWQHVRTNRPGLIGGSSFNFNSSNGNQGPLSQIQSLNPVNMLNQIAQTFVGFFKFCSLAKWGKEMDASRSFIRVQNPNKMKVGGGHRVAKITMTDNWGDDTGNSAQTQTVGTVYDYTTVENGDTISTGVAQYEPMIGGDENPFRQADFFADGPRTMTKNNLFFEHPVNEQYMPGPIVGYSKVTIKSLTTQQVIDGQLGSHIPTTGAAVHEFFTAKDYPVLVNNTPLEVKTKQSFIPIPLIGQITYNGSFSSQGFSVRLNDMHGKPKMVSNYRQDSNGQLDLTPVSWVKYHYIDEVENAGTDREYRTLKSAVNTLVYDVDPNDFTKSETETRLLGLEHEFFLDMRESESSSGSVGLNVNAELVGIAIIPPIWPSFSDASTLLRTVSTNKVIHQTGIMDRMEAYNEGSLVETNNLLWDAQTGQVLLSSVTNDYDDPVYSYSYPAHWAYDRMGAAYQNIGLEFTASNIGTDQGGGIYPATLNTFGGTAHPDSLLAPGDEFVVNASGTMEHAIYVGKDGSGNYLFFCQNNITNTSGDTGFKLVRSGRRNHLTVNAQEVVALKNPTRDRRYADCMRDLANPGQMQNSLNLVTGPAECVENFFSMLNLVFPVYPGASSTFEYDLTSTPYSDYDICWNYENLRIFTDPDDIIELWTGEQNCEFVLYASDGTIIDLVTVQEFVDQSLVSTYPGPTISNQQYTGYQIEYLDMNNTTQYAYAFTEFNGCDWPTESYYESVSVPGANPGPDTLTVTMFMMDSVLSATATTFSEAWPQDYNAITPGSGTSKANLEGWHPYASGEMGIWRMKANYLYTDDRRQSLPLNTREDGTLLDVPVFDHNSLVFDYCAGKWILENEVTAYSPYSFELENRDVQGIYSAALYAYRGQWPIAVAGNAKMYEIAFEGFEEYTAGGTIDPENMASTNLDIYNDYNGPYSSLPTIHENHDVLYGDGTIVNYNTAPGNLSTTPVKVQAKSEGSIWNQAEYFGGVENLTNDSPLANEPYFHLKPSGLYWRGRIGLPQPWLAWNPVGYTALNSTQVAISDAKAHTGKHAVKILGNYGFPQNRFLPEEGKQYALQLWVSRDNDIVPTYRSTATDPTAHMGIRMEFLDAGNSVISTSDLMEPAGPLVEGWQKIEGDFWVPSGTKKLRMVWQSGKDTDNNYLAAYFDDVRLQPFQSSMKTYVYDTGDWRLQAVLDDDNFATLYRYDPAGNLVLVMKETYDGLRAIQESRAFVQEQ